MQCTELLLYVSFALDAFLWTLKPDVQTNDLSEWVMY